MMTRNKHTARRIVIVGGGVSGLSIAVRLSQSGLPVMVLESSSLGQAASTKNQGWLYSGACSPSAARSGAIVLRINAADDQVLPRVP